VVLLQLGADFGDEAWPAAEQRIALELKVAGFDVLPLVGTTHGEHARRAELARMAELHNAVAAVSLRRVIHDQSLEVWLTDRVTDKVLNRRFSPDTDARVVGLRTLELLHASLIELKLPAHPVAVAPPPQVVATVATLLPSAADQPPPNPWQLAVGLSVTKGTTQVAAMAGPTLSMQTPTLGPGHLLVSALVITKPAELHRQLGTAQLSRSYAQLGYRWSPWEVDIWSPYVALQLGVAWTKVHAETMAPAVAHDRTLVSPLASATLGLQWQFLEPWGLYAAAAGGWVQRSTHIKFGQIGVGRLSREFWGLELGLAARIPGN